MAGYLPVVRVKQHFGAYTTDAISVSTDPDNPTYVTGIALFELSSAGFELIDAATGLIKNNTGRNFSMQGTVTYQLLGTGSTASLRLWSERSDDDGLSFTENAFSLRVSEASNNENSSHTKSSAVETWKHGESIRWAMYNGAGGSVVLSPPSATVNGGNVVQGFSLYWQLNEV